MRIFGNGQYLQVGTERYRLHAEGTDGFDNPTDRNSVHRIFSKMSQWGSHQKPLWGSEEQRVESTQLQGEVPEFRLRLFGVV